MDMPETASFIDWFDQMAISLESDCVRIVVIPTMGAKIVSLYDKVNAYEWLAEPMRPLKPAGYGADFVSQDMSGWDEMMPTISACRFRNITLPDHGEVWGIPWNIDKAAAELCFSVNGVALPYHFSRCIAFENEHTLLFQYSLTNTGEQIMPFLWAAHPQFNADESTRILLPDEIDYLLNVIADHPNWGRSESQVTWPAARDLHDVPHQLDRIGPADLHACRKFYTDPGSPAAWAALQHHFSGSRLRMEWSTADLPYLGLWVDEGVYNAKPVVALEPASGYFDSLENAIARKQVNWLMPGAQMDWQLRLVIGNETD